uniref:Hydrophobin n=1 Tax=Talaromyces marneffei PM1 TaxID=1077442 RepID=A0A093UXC7_TALMA
MHFNFACITACVFAAAALAVPVEVERKVVVVRADGPSVDNKQCSAGTSVHCCDTVDSTDNSNVLNQLNAAGIDHSDAKQKGQVGLTCTPITTSLIDAINGNVCQGAVTACCENTSQTGLVNLNLGCTIIPVTL